MAEKNPLFEINRRAMEYIWSQVPKEVKEGKEYVTYLKTDLPYLYYSGLVDTEKFSLELWEKGFQDCLGEDGRYWVSHEKMLWLGNFRYHRIVNEPFDPLRMRTGKYKVERLWKLYERSIIPSCSLPKEFVKQKFDQLFRKHEDPKKLFEKERKALKDKGENVEEDNSKLLSLHFEGDTVEITREHLVNLKHFLDTYPSPRRKMEIAVQDLKTEKLQQLSEVAAKPQQSSYEGGKDFRETTKQDLKDMLVKASEKAAGGRKPTGEVLDLKGLQKKNRPTKF